MKPMAGYMVAIEGVDERALLVPNYAAVFVSVGAALEAAKTLAAQKGRDVYVVKLCPTHLIHKPVAVVDVVESP